MNNTDEMDEIAKEVMNTISFEIGRNPSATDKNMIARNVIASALRQAVEKERERSKRLREALEWYKRISECGDKSVANKALKDYEGEK